MTTDQKTPVTPATVQPAMPGRGLGWCATGAIIAALVIICGAGLLRSSWTPGHLALPVLGPPWELGARVPPKVVIVGLWIAELLAIAGVVAGLVAVRRGQPLPFRTLITAVIIGVAVLTVTPPAGSTDALDYAVYGHIAALGHSPYVMTPAQFRQLAHVRLSVPVGWEHVPSVYGPLATAEQLAAAKIAGSSLARTVFVLKLFDAIAFGAIALAADKLLRADRASRLRAHLLWTANPLILWSVIAAGHLDVLAAAFGLAGVLILDRRVAGNPLLRAFAAGLCIGAAVDIKADYALFGLGAAWALRRKPGQLLAAAGGAVAILLPSYAAAGLPAVKALANRAGGRRYGLYGWFFHKLEVRGLHDVLPLAVLLLIPLAWLLLQRLPASDRPALRAALALSVAWLFVWPHQFAWYSVMIFCVLVFYPASRLDWLVLAWFGAMTIADSPGLGAGGARKLGHLLTVIQKDNLYRMAPLVMLIIVIAAAVLCITRRWHAASTLCSHACARRLVWREGGRAGMATGKPGWAAGVT
jgi:hypothetical protein